MIARDWTREDIEQLTQVSNFDVLQARLKEELPAAISHGSYEALKLVSETTAEEFTYEYGSYTDDDARKGQAYICAVSALRMIKSHFDEPNFLIRFAHCLQSCRAHARILLELDRQKEPALSDMDRRRIADDMRDASPEERVRLREMMDAGRNTAS